MDYQKKFLKAIFRDHEVRGTVKDSLALISMIVSLFLLFFCVGCSTTVSIVNTHGHAEDVVDTEQKSDADISPEISIPAGAL